MKTIWSFLLVLSVLIFIHELGHFLVARAFGIRVLRFSIGFGNRIWGVVRGGTDYCISLFPLGGFVKMLGESPEEPVEPRDVPVSFSHRPVWQRAVVVAAGPLSNLGLAWAIFFVIFLAYGNPILLPVIGEVQQGSPAAGAGLVSGDVIRSANGREIRTWDEVSRAIRAGGGAAISLQVERDGQIRKVSVTPRMDKLKNIFGEEVNTPVIGVTAAGNLEIERLDPLSAFGHAWTRTWDIIVLTGQGFWKLIQRVVPLSSLGGPIMIAQMAGQQAELGPLNLFFFMALLSINLGLLNLLPIPALDGGHLVLFGIEVLRGRPLSMPQQEIIQKVGMAIIGTIMLFVFYNDIARLFGFIPTPGTP